MVIRPYSRQPLDCQQLVRGAMGSPVVGSACTLLLLLLLSLPLFLSSEAAGTGYPEPPNCKSLECPYYRVIHTQKDFEIRKYNKSVWMSTMPINSSSYREASKIGFDYLFAYIQGKNAEGVKIDMTAPVLVDIFPSTGPFCNSTFVMHFYVPSKYQSNPPGSSEVYKKYWPRTKENYVAVRRIGGSMDDGSVIAMQAAKLTKSLKGTRWEKAVAAAAAARNHTYSVAGYNSPFEYVNRVNEIMFEF